MAAAKERGTVLGGFHGRLTLRSRLDDANPLYIPPRENIVDDVLVPAFECADTVDCMMGFFSSRSLAEIAPGMAIFLARTQKPLRLVVSPYLSPDDQQAIKEGLKPAGRPVHGEFVITLRLASGTDRGSAAKRSDQGQHGRAAVRQIVLLECCH